jgi:hypothetical protein
MCIPAGTALGYVYGGLVRLLAQFSFVKIVFIVYFGWWCSNCFLSVMMNSWQFFTIPVNCGVSFP